MGKLKFAQFDSVTADKVIIVTEENVLAALSSKNGDILWRRVLETEDSRGEVKFLYVTRDSKNIASPNSEGDPFGIITVSGHNPILFRGWDITNGNLAWEWSITPTSENAENSQFFFKETNIYHVLPVWNSHIELTEYHASTGQQRTATTSKITAGWITKENCVLNSNSFICLVKDQILVLDVLAESNNIRTKAVEASNGGIKLVKGQEGFIQVGRQVISLKDLQTVFEDRNSATFFMDTKLIQLVKNNKDITITSEDQELTVLSDIPETLDNDLHIISVKCKLGNCRFLLSTRDGAIVLAQKSNLIRCLNDLRL